MSHPGNEQQMWQIPRPQLKSNDDYDYAGYAGMSSHLSGQTTGSGVYDDTRRIQDKQVLFRNNKDRLSSSGSSMSGKSDGQHLKIFVGVLVLLVVLGGLGTGGYFIYKHYHKDTSTTDTGTEQFVYTASFVDQKATWTSGLAIPGSADYNQASAKYAGIIFIGFGNNTNISVTVTGFKQFTSSSMFLRTNTAAQVNVSFTTDIPASPTTTQTDGQKMVTDAINSGANKTNNTFTKSVVTYSGTVSITTTTSLSPPITKGITTTPTVPVNTTTPPVPVNTTTPPVPVNTTTPPVPVNTTTPPVPLNTTTPPVPVNTTTPLVPVNTTTPHVPVNTTTPPVPVNTTTPPVPVNTTTPPVPVNTTTPPVPVNTTTPHVPVNTTTQPVPANTTTPPVPVNTTTPHVPVNTTTPPVPVNTTTQPVPANTTTPPVPVNTTTPSAPVGTTTPAAPVGTTTPAAPVGTTTPGAPVSTTTPAAPVGTTTPAAPVGTTTPGAPVGTTTPAAPVGTTTPAAPVGTTTPGAPVSTTTPAAPVGTTTPAAPVGTTTPGAPVGTTTPAAPVGTTTPAAPVGTTTPAGPVGTTTPAAPVGTTTPAAPVVTTTPVAPVGTTTPTAPVGTTTPPAPVGTTTPTAPVGTTTPPAPVVTTTTVAPVSTTTSAIPVGTTTLPAPVVTTTSVPAVSTTTPAIAVSTTTTPAPVATTTPVAPVVTSTQLPTTSSASTTPPTTDTTTTTTTAPTTSKAGIPCLTNTCKYGAPCTTLPTSPPSDYCACPLDTNGTTCATCGRIEIVSNTSPETISNPGNPNGFVNSSCTYQLTSTDPNKVVKINVSELDFGTTPGANDKLTIKHSTSADKYVTSNFTTMTDISTISLLVGRSMEITFNTDSTTTVGKFSLNYYLDDPCSGYDCTYRNGSLVINGNCSTTPDTGYPQCTCGAHFIKGDHCQTYTDPCIGNLCLSANTLNCVPDAATNNSTGYAYDCVCKPGHSGSLCYG